MTYPGGAMIIDEAPRAFIDLHVLPYTFHKVSLMIMRSHDVLRRRNPMKYAMKFDEVH